MALRAFMSLKSSFDSVVTDFSMHILQNTVSGYSSCLSAGVQRILMLLDSHWENSGCFNKLRGMGDGGAASVLPRARAGRVCRAQWDSCLSLHGCVGIVGSPLCCVELNSGASWCYRL